MINFTNTKFSKKFLRRILIALLLALAIAVIGIIAHIIQYFLLRKDTRENAILTVATIQAMAGPATQEIILPGNVQGWHQATIYARTNGYVVEWLTDIGAHVKENDLLAVISTPELDEQLHQAEAQLKTAIANYQLAEIKKTRWQVLLKTNSVSKQEYDDKVSDAIAQKAIVDSMLANRDRLRKLVNFERVVAPFTGIIKSRTTDIGRLINAGSGGKYPLFGIVQSDRLRIYVRVPQYYSAHITPTLQAELHFPQFPNKIFIAKLLNTANAIDVNSRSLLVQFEIDNKDDALLPGNYTEVHLKIPTNSNIVRLPVNTLIFRAQNLQVATINNKNKTELKSITIGRDFGDSIEVVSGIKPGETVIINPSDSLMNGQEVRVVAASGLSKQAEKKV